jgi:CubicO group peptidase (beta-lactamase class C family)
MKLLLLAALLCQEDPGIEEVLKRKVDTEGPGAAVLAIRKGKVIHRKGYGRADLDTREKVTAETLFDLASCSKQFTGVAILLLAEREKLNLMQDARIWLSELKIHDLGRPIEVTDLVHHTSGLADYLGLASALPNMPTMDNKEVLRLVAKRKLEFPTGQKWSYSNTNYCLLALIVERISKKSFGAFMRDEIFRGAGMKTAVVEEPGVTLKNRATGYERRGTEYVKHAGGPMTTGDGGIFLSLDDWAAFEKNRFQLLRQSSWKEAVTPGKLDDGKAHDYGFGLTIQKENGKTIVGHEGEWAGFRSYFVRWEDDDATLVIMANRNNLDLGGLADAIAPHLFK